jgi:hypothetical protein
MKVCKTCKGKGWLFANTQVIAKWERFFGVDMPIFKLGTEKKRCGKCFGKGVV